MPYSVGYYPEAVVLEGKVFIGAGSSSDSKTIMVYTIEHDEWNVLPPYEYFWFGMTSINNSLILVGGVKEDSDDRTNQLGVWDEKRQNWTHPFPQMPTACSGSTVVTYEDRWLMVAGGYTATDAMLSSVEILDIFTGYWYHASPLPIRQYKMSSVIIGNMWYLLGGYIYYPNEHVLCACIDDLIYKAVLQHNSPSPWQLLPDTPCSKPTALVLNGSLLAVGGKAETNLKTIHLYQPSNKRWVEFGDLPIAKRECACAVLPSGEVFIAGGYGSMLSSDSQVHIGTLKN